MKKLTKGPNDVSRIVWTRFRHPCPPYHIYSIIQPIYICKTLISMKKHEEKKKTHLGSKRCVLRRLDPFSSSQLSLSHI